MGAILLLALYTLPDGPPPAAPDAAQQARLERALAAIGEGAGEAAEVALRDLALLGECALPAVVARLNEAEAGERLLLLAAVERVARAAPLLEQARSDPSPAVRAWVSPPPRRKPDSLRTLAGRYLDLLALAEAPRRKDAQVDAEGLPSPLGRDPTSLERLRERMIDREFAVAVQAQRTRAALEWAAAGKRSLGTPDLPLDPRNPLFLAYAALLREEGRAFYEAVTAFVALGNAAVPVLETLLGKETFDARVLVRLLIAMREDGGAGLYARDWRPDVTAVLLEMAPPGAPIEEFSVRAAAGEDPAVLGKALDRLLDLPPPAGLGLARSLFDPMRLNPADFARVAALLARAGEVENLAAFIEAEIPAEASDRAERLRQAREACVGALRAHRGPATRALAAHWSGSASPRLRLLSVEFTEARELLLPIARADPDPPMATAATRRLVECFGAEAAGEAAAVLRARPEIQAGGVIHLLGAAGAAETLVGLAQEPSPRLSLAALRELASMESLDRRFEETLLRLHDEGREREATLAALLPLGTDEVRKRVVAAGVEALRPLLLRTRVPFAVPLLPLIAGGDHRRRESIARLATLLPETEPGLFLALLKAAGEDETREKEQRLEEQLTIARELPRTTDAASAGQLFDELVAGGQKDPRWVLLTLQASTRLLPAERLRALLPPLRAAAEKERAGADKAPPPYDEWRQRFLYGGINALAWSRVPEALDDFMAFLLDPGVQPQAYDGKEACDLRFWALDALRNYDPARVEEALQRRIAAMEASGDLARLHPDDIFDLVESSRSGIDRGRPLYEVALILCRLLDRLPWRRDALLDESFALSGLGRLKEAAAVARRLASLRLARGFAGDEDAWSADRLERRARLMEAVEARDPSRFAPAAGDDPEMQRTAAWNLLWYGISVEEADRMASAAVRATAGLAPLQRDALANVRLVQNRPKEALDQLELAGFLHERIRGATGWHSFLMAKAMLMLGRAGQAELKLEEAFLADRTLIGVARADPLLQSLAHVFAKSDEDFYDSLFAWEQ